MSWDPDFISIFLIEKANHHAGVFSRLYQTYSLPTLPSTCAIWQLFIRPSRDYPLPLLPSDSPHTAPRLLSAKVQKITLIINISSGSLSPQMTPDICSVFKKRRSIINSSERHLAIGGDGCEIVIDEQRQRRDTITFCALNKHRSWLAVCATFVTDSRPKLISFCRCVDGGGVGVGGVTPRLSGFSTGFLLPSREQFHFPNWCE